MRPAPLCCKALLACSMALSGCMQYSSSNWCANACTCTWRDRLLRVRDAGAVWSLSAFMRKVCAAYLPARLRVPSRSHCAVCCAAGESICVAIDSVAAGSAILLRACFATSATSREYQGGGAGSSAIVRLKAVCCSSVSCRRHLGRP